MTSEEKYYEALKVIAQDMVDTIDINNEQAVEQYIGLTTDIVLDQVQDLELEPAVKAL